MSRLAETVKQGSAPVVRMPASHRLVRVAPAAGSLPPDGIENGTEKWMALSEGFWESEFR